MALRILIVPDKLKGTLTARQAAEALAAGWRRGRPDDALECLPMSDGGDGFGVVLSELLGAQARTTPTLDAAHRSCEATWWLDNATRTAVIESASIIGLAMLPAGKFHPFELDTEGLGLVLGEAARQGAERCLVGIGGSATNDGGMGMARALGWRFLNTHGATVDRWTDLHALSQISPPDRPGLFRELTVAVDVQNPLLGPQGCSRIYGPQKGLRPQDFEFAERCLGALATVLQRQRLANHAATPGGGAAGGLGFGLLSFCGARMEPGFALFARLARLPDKLRQVDLVLTAEGGLDEQTLMGKGVGELANLCREHQVPCVAFAGVVKDPEKARRLFAGVHAMTPDLATKEEAMSRPGPVLEELARRAADAWESPRKST